MAIPFIAERKEVKLRGYFMRHKTGGDVGFSWKKDDPKFSDEWERIAAVPEVVSAPIAGERQSETISEFAAFAAVMRAEVDPHASDDSIKFAWNMGFGKLWRGARSAGDAVPVGHVQVPAVATKDMLRAGMRHFSDKREPATKAWQCYRDMIDAAPAPGNTEKPAPHAQDDDKVGGAK